MGISINMLFYFLYSELRFYGKTKFRDFNVIILKVIEKKANL